MKIRVARAFLLRGERQEPGSTVEVDDALARELVMLNKAEALAPMPPASGPMTTQTAPGIVAGRKAKGAKHAGQSGNEHD